MLEAAVLKFFLQRENFSRFYSHIQKLTLEPHLATLYSLLPLFYENKQEEVCSLDDLKALFAIEYPRIKDPEVYMQLFTQIEQIDLSQTVLEKMVARMVYKDTINRIIQAGMPALSNDFEEDAIEKIRKLLADHESTLAPENDPNLFVTDDLHELLESEVYGKGLRWRLQGLNDSIGELRKCSLGHIFARPDVGKTTFLISEMSYWAGQLEQNEIGIWVNNEEKGKKLRLRWYSAVTGWPKAAIAAQPDRAIQFYNTLPGSRVKLIDKAGMTDRRLEEIIKQYRPRFMIIDQGDKVKTISGSKDSETKRLGALYQQYREWAKDYELDILTAGQAHADAAGQKWLRDSWMNNSKTEKPGELDYAIGVGVDGIVTDQDMRRFISVCKNKNGPHAAFPAMMDPVMVRYSDI